MEISDFGGWATFAPKLATFFLIALLASIGLPTLCNFIGEFLVLQGAALVRFSWSVWAAIGVILSAAYMLWLYQRTFLGKTQHQHEPHHTQYDLRPSEWAPVAILIAMMVWLGTYTQSFMPPISSATGHLLDLTSISNQYRVGLPKIDLRQPSDSVQVAEASRAR